MTLDDQLNSTLQFTYLIYDNNDFDVSVANDVAIDVASFALPGKVK